MSKETKEPKLLQDEIDLLDTYRSLRKNNEFVRALLIGYCEATPDFGPIQRVQIHHHGGEVAIFNSTWMTIVDHEFKGDVKKC